MPLHFIDTGILFEANKDTGLGNQCSDYLNRVGYKYRGIAPLSVIGEFFMVTFRDVEKSEERHLLFSFMDNLIKRRKIRFSALRHDSIRLVDGIKETDSRVEDTDAIHLANCIQDNGDTFVTFDKKLLENVRLENEFKVKIIHPGDL
ncbi:MAG: PIN domain-containing protein [Candidatus Aenigmarchaeota archaeon]|nr:PIN domain-containing protein [Candidatus Aenigmarchaeota archaeon]